MSVHSCRIWPRPLFLSPCSPRWCSVGSVAVGLFKKSKVQPPPPEGSVGLSEKSKVQPPPVGGSVGLSEKSKVQGGGVQILGGGWYKVTLV